MRYEVFDYDDDFDGDDVEITLEWFGVLFNVFEMFSIYNSTLLFQADGTQEPGS